MYSFIQVCQAGQERKAAQVDPGAPQGQHDQPEHRGECSDQQEVAEVDGPTLHQRGSAGSEFADRGATGDQGDAGEDPGEGAAGLEGDCDTCIAFNDTHDDSFRGELCYYFRQDTTIGYNGSRGDTWAVQTEVSAAWSQQGCQAGHSYGST